MKLIFSLSLFLFSVTTLLAQTLYTRNDSIHITQDSVTIKAGPFRGNIQWQKSLDNTNWINLEGKTSDSLRVKTAIEAKYRAAITDGMCLPVYSDSVAIVTADTITNNYVDPGETGLILISDSTNISNGDYIYTGADATNNFEIGKIIIDEQAGGTIRRITEVIQTDDTVSVKTDQATMEDLFQGASFKLSTEMVYPEQNMKSASIAVIEKALTDKDGFIHPVEVIYETQDGIRMKSASIFKRSENAQGGTLYMHKDWSGTKFYDLTGSFKLPNKNGVLISYSGNVKSYISEGYFTFDPIFKFEFEFDRPRINWENFNVSKGEITKFKFYSDRSQIDFKNILAFESTIAYEFGKEWTLVPKIINSKFKFLVGGVYIWIDFKIDINCSLTAEFASGTITTQGFENNNYITIGAGYENKNWYTIKDIEKENQVFASTSGFTNSGFRFEIFPSVEIKLYSIVGPYLKVGPYLSYESTKSLSENWDKKIDVGVDANLGVSVDVFGREIASLNSVNWNFFNANLWKAPGYLFLISGDNQSAEIGNILPEPIAVKVTNSLNQPVNDVQVHFLPSSGSVEQPMVKTDAIGLAQTSWTLSNNAGEQGLKVYLLDGKDQQIEGCSLTVLATATNTNLPTVANETGTLTDSRDGKTYKTVKIGTQWWMAENLAYLPVVYPSSNEYDSYTDPRYYVYNYQDTDVEEAKATANYTTYGVLYNWPAAKAACPPGWHLPSDAEWTALENYLSASDTTSGNYFAKSMAATTNWIASSNTGAIGNNLSLNNKSGFSALPAGYRSGVTFDGIGDFGGWWSSTEDDWAYYACPRSMNSYSSNIHGGVDSKEVGYSVRCVRD